MQGMRKAKTQLELKLLRNLKGNKNVSQVRINIKRNSKKNVGLLLNRVSNLMTKDTEKVRYLMLSSLLLGSVHG